jgi:hypothetical protein
MSSSALRVFITMAMYLDMTEGLSAAVVRNCVRFGLSMTERSDILMENMRNASNKL